jgi:hypothetical protein
MTEHAPDRLWSGIQISKVVAGTLAAVSAAVIGSFLGVAGTLAGAAIASIVGSVGTEIYQRSLDRGAKKLQTLTPTFVKAPAAIGTPEVAAATEEDSPSHTVPEELKQDSPEDGATPEGGAVEAPKRQVRWGRVALAAAALFVFALIPLTFVEMASGRTIANLVGSSQATGTTLGTAVTGEERKPATTPSEAPSEAPAGEESADPSTEDQPGEPAEAPTSTEPTADPTATTPATDAPTTGAPQEEPTDPQPNEPFSGNQPQGPQQGNE